jgi:hypothetical protein
VCPLAEACHLPALVLLQASSSSLGAAPPCCRWLMEHHKASCATKQQLQERMMKYMPVRQVGSLELGCSQLWTPLAVDSIELQSTARRCI